jgi:Group II intron, maturase-specific domain
VLRGWVNYYGHFQRSALHTVFDPLDRYLERWLRRKYKRLKYKVSRAREMLAKSREVTRRCLFTGLWPPMVDNRSRMKREPQVRLCEGLGCNSLGLLTYEPSVDEAGAGCHAPASAFFSS